MKNLQVFGGFGFVGMDFVDYFNEWTNPFQKLIVNAKYDYEVRADSDVLYLISTNNNYNVFTNSHLDINTNLSTLMTVLDQFRENSPYGVFNFVSSWFVYGDTDLPAREDSYCNPKGFYSITKRTAEQLLISYCETFNLKYRILRLANVVGIADYLNASKKKNALQYLLKQLSKNEPIELYHNGEFYRDYIYVRDVSRAIMLVLLSNRYNEIFNISNGNKILFKDMIDLAKVILKSESKITNIDAKQFHKTVQVKDMYLDNSKIVGMGYIPEYPSYVTMISRLCSVINKT